jgi:hypothetical protein
LEVNVTNSSLVPTRLSSNDIPSLAQIFAASLQAYCKSFSPSEKDYIDNLKTIVGLGFTAIIIDGGLLSIYQPCLSTFLAHIGKKQTSDIHNTSLAVARMIDSAVGSFRRIRYPDYYQSFVKAVKETLDRTNLHGTGKGEEAERLLRILFGK